MNATDFALHYRIQPLDPHAHRFGVGIEIHRPPPGPLRLAMPAWIPGSYMIRDFARNLSRIQAWDADGQPLTLQQIDKQTWTSAAPIDGPVRIRYEVFAWELSVRAAHLDGTHGYFNGPALLLRVMGLDRVPCQVELTPPAGEDIWKSWRLATSLQPLQTLDSGFGLYWAEDYEDLIDHPAEMGHFTDLQFQVRGIPHRLVIAGRHHADTARLTTDLTRLCERQAALFGELPLERYLFLVAAVGEGYGGLEHRASASLLCARDDLPHPDDPGSAPDEGYRRFLGLCSHEYFHLWLVKRIRPQALIEGGLDREVHTRDLWAFEGITSYYDDLMLLRSGCIDLPAYLGLLAATITRVLRTPGRRRQSLTESSFEAWTKFYRQDEDAPNAIVSYYTKGALAALALDLTLRRDTGGAVSLDHLLRALWERHGRTGIGVPERGIEALAEQVSGLDLSDFFARLLDGTEDPDLPGLLATVGVGMRCRAARDAKDVGGYLASFDASFDASFEATDGSAADRKPRPSLELRLRPGGGEATVAHAMAGGAGERAGVAPGDVIVAVDGLRANAANLERLVARAAMHANPGSSDAAVRSARDASGGRTGAGGESDRPRPSGQVSERVSRDPTLAESGGTGARSPSEPARHAPGIRLHLFRRDELLTLIAHPQPAPLDTCELSLLDPATLPEGIVQARAAWLAGLG